MTDTHGELVSRPQNLTATSSADRDAVLHRALDALAEATTHRTGFTLGFLATSGVDGGPRVRAVILRAFDRQRVSVMVATDARSAKVAEIEASRAVALTVWDEEAGVQLRLEGTGRVVRDDAERTRAWEALSESSRSQYGGFEHFAWLELRVRRLDWLDLSTAPHERWILTREAYGDAWAGGRVPA